MPELPIVDSHVHLWDPLRFRMPWLDGNANLDRPYGLAEYRAAMEGIDVAAMVYLQVEVDPAYALLEARWAVDRAREDPRLRAVVAWAPVEHGERARSYLDALVAVDPLIRGVRRIVQSEPDPGFAIRPDFVRGVQVLAEYRLTFDLCIQHSQMPAAVELVRRCPGVSFILDHIGKPSIREGLLDPWRAQIRELASMPNVICKVSGMVTESDHRAWTPDDLRPFLEHVLESFGEDRVAFGGDWPVVTEASTYRRWVETLDDLTSGLSPTAKRGLWSENARRFYRIG
jgi:L-fuconolactonase